MKIYEIMTTQIRRYPVASIAIFIWIGFICSISFMEAWLKFQSPSVTVPIGLSIGKLVFGALNKSEWIFATVVLVHLAINKNQLSSFLLVFFLIPLALLMIQTFFTLPALNGRVNSVLLNLELAPSFLHFYYLFMDIVKVICLFIFGVGCFHIQNEQTLQE